MRLIGKNADGARYLLWPIRFARHHELYRSLPRARWFDWHGWQVGYERVRFEKTSFGMMPGLRAVFGQTLHFGQFFVTFGKRNDERWRRPLFP